MRSCNTSVARSMGYLSRPSIEEDVHGGSVHVLGPSTGVVSSYHQGMSSREAFVAARSAFKKAGGRVRNGRTVLFVK